MSNAYEHARPRDALELILAKHGRPFGGKSPGGGWTALDATSIDLHLDHDRDARFKPPSFVPLARRTDGDLFGVRVTLTGFIPSYYSLNRRSICDAGDLVSLEGVFAPRGLVGFTDLMRSRMRAVFTGTAVDVRPDSGIRALFLEPLCIGDPDALVIRYAQQAFDALRGGDPRVAALFGTEVQAAWDWRPWLAASRLLLAEARANPSAAESAVSAYENAVYALIIGSARLQWNAEAIWTRFVIETEIWPMLRELESVPSFIPLVTASAGMLAALLAFQDRNVAERFRRVRAEGNPFDGIAYDLGMAECFREEDPRKYDILRRYGLPLRL